MHRALAGFCLVALCVPAGAAGSTADELPPSDAPALAADLGGAIYSPFVPANGPVAVAPTVPAARMRREEEERSPSLAATTVTAFIAAGLLSALVRMLMSR